MIAIEANGLSKRYPGGVDAVRGIDLYVEPGEAFGLLGPNGAGKSTTIGMLTTTILPTAGSARVAGHDVARDPLAARRASSVVFQDAVVDRALSGRRHLVLHARLWGVPRREIAARVDEMVDALSLSGLIDRPLASYSGGERRRLELARALVSRPQVLFLDEPTVGLDPRIRRELLDVIAGLRGGGTTILMTTHYLDEASAVCDRVAFVHAGQIVAQDAPAALLERLGPQVLELRLQREAPDVLSLLRRRGLAGEDAFAVRSTLTVPLHGRPLAEAVAAIEELGLDAAISSRSASLEDVYLRLTGDAALAA